jgi:hypothetical protein
MIPPSQTTHLEEAKRLPKDDLRKWLKVEVETDNGAARDASLLDVTRHADMLVRLLDCVAESFGVRST